ncbi:MAG: hypothetical protein GY810_01235 [Aureispira sp.]|nr:hypothetical protein [Aureispira sp.]
MKLRILSDLHLEFGTLKITALPDDKDTILVLAGDIGVGMSAIPFIDEMCERFAHVIYVMGNHEFYRNYKSVILENWRAVSESKSNLHVLENCSVVIDGILFLGGTMWTDVDNDCWFAKQKVKKGMNDFRAIKHFSVEDSIACQKETREYFLKTLEQDHPGKVVIVTHHLPHEICIVPEFKGNILNPGFVSSNLEEVFDYSPDLWIYGHTHTPFDKVHRNTHLICNPRGYCGYENTQDYNQELTIEV